jgi:hypothetical protein
MYELLPQFKMTEKAIINGSNRVLSNNPHVLQFLVFSCWSKQTAT